MSCVLQRKPTWMWLLFGSCSDWLMMLHCQGRRVPASAMVGNGRLWESCTRAGPLIWILLSCHASMMRGGSHAVVWDSGNVKIWIFRFVSSEGTFFVSLELCCSEHLNTDLQWTLSSYVKFISQVQFWTVLLIFDIALWNSTPSWSVRCVHSTDVCLTVVVNWEKSSWIV